MYKLVVFEKEEKYINDFLLLPKKLYSKREIMQNEKEERKILEEKHVLNKYFKQYKILIYNKFEEVCGRCIITIYNDTDVAYIGYFECIEDKKCANKLFEEAEEYVKKERIKKLIGTVDSSFWIKYRLKINGFDKKPYTGEPYNKSYYKEMFEENGYNILENWVSNIYTKLPLVYKKKTVYKERLEVAEKNSYKIITPKPKDFDVTLDIVYELISETFKDFVTFREITKEDFREIFKDYKYILDYNFVKIAYYKEEPVAFSIVLPDYKNLLYGKLTIYKKIRIFLKKIRSDNYVSLYMGVKKEHKGLGKALTQKIVKNVYIRRSGCVGALITKGKITEKYVEEQINKKNEYVLFEKEIELI